MSTLPASEVRVTETATPDSIGNVADYGRGRAILWVDDNPNNNRDEREELEARGFRITLSRSTRDALERLRKSTFDLIISDMGRGRQPRAGLDLLEALRHSGDATPYVLYASHHAIRYEAEAVNKGALGIITTAPELYALIRQAVTSERRKVTPMPPAEHLFVTPARVFIAYKRATELDGRVSSELYRHLSGLGHRVFIDQTMVIGTQWAALIAEEVRNADFLVPLLSASSVNSEMVISEIEMAHHLYKEQGRPALLPVRLDYREPFQYPLSAYLNPLNWFLWERDEDTPRLLAAIERAISGRAPLQMSGPPELSSYAPTGVETTSDLRPFPSAQPLPEGTMSPESRFYIERRTDAVALAAIEKEGVTMVIKGPRQMGKSSLLLRLIDRATAINKSAVFLDFQLFDTTALGDKDRFLRTFCSWLSYELAIPDRTEEFWSSELGSTQNCTRYIRRYILSELPGRLCLAMDEADRIFETDFRSDFFSMLRAWHNERARPGSPWRRLDLVLVTATEPYLLIENLNQSPFNVGEVVFLQDFDEEQVAELNMRYDGLLHEQDIRDLVSLLHGHPYLTRRAFYLVASKNASLDELLSTAATDDRGPFGDHLRYYLFLIHNRGELVEGMARVLRGAEISDPAVFFRLNGAGLLRRDATGRIVPRCQLYADYFSQHLL